MTAMIRPTLKKRFLDRSIFLKILSVIILSAVIVNIIVTIFFYTLIFEPMHGINRFVFKCANYIMEDVEDELSPSLADELANRFEIDYRLESGKGLITSNDRIPPLNEIKLQKEIVESNQTLGYHDGKLYLILYREHGTYIVIPKFFFDMKTPEVWILSVLLLLSVIFFAVYYTLKSLLSPIHQLREGVEQVKEGNFDYQLAVGGEDELGSLKAAFNDMSQRIKGLLYSKEQLILNVSHELRSPLTRMKLATEFLPDHSKKESILSDIQLMESMVAELLESAKLEQEGANLQKERVKVTELLEEVCRKFSGITPAVECDYPDPSLEMTVDRVRIQTVLKNLVENAMKYAHRSSEPVKISAKKSNDRIEVEISDSGEGIPEKDLPYIFEPFYRVDKSRSKETGGYGLGLSICKQIVEAHQGTIEIHSEPGRGTRVRFCLPAGS